MQAPVRMFGDIHGQLPDLLFFFRKYGLPTHRTGDVHLVNYLFIGDFVDRGLYSLEVLLLLLSLKIRYPENVVLLRGNHEDREGAELLFCLHLLFSSLTKVPINTHALQSMKYLDFSMNANRAYPLAPGGSSGS
jgi:hypothetical protein